MLCPRDPAAAGYALFKDAAVLGRARADRAGARPIESERLEPRGLAADLKRS
jgi:hypothetical protein